MRLLLGGGPPRSVGGRVTWASGLAGVFQRGRSNGLFEVDGLGLGDSAAQPRWLCGCWSEADGDGSEHAGIRAG